MPDTEAYETVELIGEGTAGKTYHGTRPDGSPCAVKVLDALAVNARVLGFSLDKLAGLNPPAGVVPILDRRLDETPMFLATPLYGEQTAEGFLPNSLERLGPQLSTGDKWKIIEDLAETLGWLHRHGIPHTAINPGNVFLVLDDEDCTVRLTDLALGWMRDIHYMDLDPLLPSLAPEQATHPEGVYEGVALGWDVYAFGVVSYWLLEGRWPRGVAFKDSIDRSNPMRASVDPEAYATALLADPAPAWSEPSRGPDDDRCRQVLERCLEIEPSARPGDLREVLLDFERIGHGREVEDLQSSLDGEQKNHSRTRWTGRAIAAGLATLLGLIALYAGLTLTRARQAEGQIDSDRKGYEKEIVDRDGTITGLEGGLEVAHRHREEAYAELEESSGTVDLLLGQLLDPAREGGSGATEHEVKLAEAELGKAREHFENKLATEAENTFDRARTLISLARIDEALGDPASALERFGQTAACIEGFLGANDDHPALLPARERLAFAYRACHRLHLQAGENEAAAAALQKGAAIARQLAQMPGALDSWKEECVRCELEVSRAQSLAGESAAALATLAGTAALATSPSLKSEVLLFEAEALRTVGDVDEAIKRHIDGVKLLSDEEAAAPGRNRLLASHCTRLAELLSDAGQPEEAIEASETAVALLTQLYEKNAKEPAFWDELARNYGLIADYQRDAGQSAQALAKATAGLDLHIACVQQFPSEPLYREGALASVTRAASLLADSSRVPESIKMLREAESGAEAYLGGTTVPVEGRRRIDAARARLLGQLGHFEEESGQKPAARESFRKASKIWESLAAQAVGEKKDLYREQAEWSGDRFSKLGG